MPRAKSLPLPKHAAAPGVIPISPQPPRARLNGALHQWSNPPLRRTADADASPRARTDEGADVIDRPDHLTEGC